MSARTTRSWPPKQIEEAPNHITLPSDRRQSFIERYVIERASHFRVGYEKEDAWRAASDAWTIYEHIARLPPTTISKVSRSNT